MAERYFSQDNWMGGDSESDLTGMRGSFSLSYAIDTHTTPGTFQAAVASAKSSGTIITEFCEFAIDASSGTASSRTYFFGNEGMIFIRSLDTVGNISWGTMYKDSARIRGAAEFNGYLYWATESVLRRMPLSGWTGDVASFGSLTSANYHPMVQMASYLLIGNGTAIATIDDTGTLTQSGIPDMTLDYLQSSYTINCLHKYGTDVLIGTKIVGGNVGAGAKLLRWDLASPSWTQEKDVPEVSVNAFLTTNDQTYFQAGDAGQMYGYTGDGIVPFHNLRILDSRTGWAYCSPQASATFKGNGYFGMHNESVYSKRIPGLYTIGRATSKSPLSMYHEFASSDWSPVVTGASYDNWLKIGAVVSGFDVSRYPYLLFAWQHNNTVPVYGVDEIYLNLTRKNGAYLETMSIGGKREAQKLFNSYNISYREKPVNTDITLQYFKNFGSELTPTGTITMIDKSGYNKLVSNEKIEAGSMKFRITLTNTAGATSKIEEFYTKFDERKVL